MGLLYLLEDIRVPVLNELMLAITTLGEEAAFLVVALVRRHKTEKQENQTTITMEKAYKIKGMMCNHCKANVERNLAKLEGVESVRVDLAEGVAYVTGDVEPQKVIELIDSLGYEYLAD